MSERRTNSGKMRNFEVDDFDSIPLRSRAPIIDRYPPPKTTIAAILLLLGGIIFICLGASILWSNLLSHGKDRGWALFILGAIMFVPGSYASIVIYGTWKGWDGYDYSMIASYDDD